MNPPESAAVPTTEPPPAVPPPPAPTTTAPSKIDPFRPRIQDLLARTPDLPIQVIFQTLRKEGYEGGRTILGDLLRRVRESRIKVQAFARYESLPGQEAQMDWSPYRVKFADSLATVHLFSLILERRFSAQSVLRPFDRGQEKPRGLTLGPLTVGNPSGYDAIFHPVVRPKDASEAPVDPAPPPEAPEGA